MTDTGQVQDSKPKLSVGRCVGIVDVCGAWTTRRWSCDSCVALGAALVPGVLAALEFARPITASEGEGAAQGAILLAHLAAAGLCWLLARAIFSRRAVSSISGMGKNQ